MNSCVSFVFSILRCNVIQIVWHFFFVYQMAKKSRRHRAQYNNKYLTDNNIGFHSFFHSIQLKGNKNVYCSLKAQLASTYSWHSSITWAYLRLTTYDLRFYILLYEHSLYACYVNIQLTSLFSFSILQSSISRIMTVVVGTQESRFRILCLITTQ